jgi:hypothetical protein
MEAPDPYFSGRVAHALNWYTRQLRAQSLDRTPEQQAIYVQLKRYEFEEVVARSGSFGHLPPWVQKILHDSGAMT